METGLALRSRPGIILSILLIICLLAASIVIIPSIVRADDEDDDDDNNYFSVESVTIEGADGDELPAHLYTPDGDEPDGGFPAIVFIHSWALNQWEYEAQMRNFADEGYVTLSYDCRGWGGAEGKIGTAGPLEMEDLNCVIDWLIDNEDVNPAKIGAVGLSYGGGQSLLGLKFEPRLKTVVSMSGWTDLEESLAPNDSPKWLWSAILVGSAEIIGREDSEMRDWLISYLMDRDTDETKEDLAVRSPINYLDDMNNRNDPSPVFIINGINDDLFTSRQIVNFYERYEGPKKLMLVNGIHGTAEASGLINLPNDVWDDTMDWFDFWLKDDSNGIMDEQPVSIYEKWDNEQGEYEGWPIPGSESFILYLSEDDGTRELSEAMPDDEESAIIYNRLIVPVTSGIPILRPLINSYLGIGKKGPLPALVELSKGTVMFESEELDNDVTVMGTPRVKLWVKPDNDKFQLNIMVYDVNERGFATLVAHSPITVKDAKKNKMSEVDLQMNVLAYEFLEGHQIRMVISTSDTAYVLPVLERYKLELFYGEQYDSFIELPAIDSDNDD